MERRQLTVKVQGVALSLAAPTNRRVDWRVTEARLRQDRDPKQVVTLSKGWRSEDRLRLGLERRF